MASRSGTEGPDPPLVSHLTDPSWPGLGAALGKVDQRMKVGGEFIGQEVTSGSLSSYERIGGSQIGFEG